MIGIFDSGVGGLTVLRALRESLPSCDVIYFGDTKHAPYGSRPREELATLTVNAIKLLQARGADNIVSACNSVSASLAVSLYDVLSLSTASLIEMVGPTVSYFKGSDARIVLCATPATIRSDIYQNGFRMIGKEVECIAIEALAGAIERGAPQSDIETIIKESFAGVHFQKGGVLVLACTHYPLVLETFRRVVGEDVVIFDPAYAVAERAQCLFWPREVGDGKTHFIVSHDSPTFRALAEDIVGKETLSIEVLE